MPTLVFLLMAFIFVEPKLKEFVNSILQNSLIYAIGIFPFLLILYFNVWDIGDSTRILIPLFYSTLFTASLYVLRDLEGITRFSISTYITYATGELWEIPIYIRDQTLFFENQHYLPFFLKSLSLLFLYFEIKRPSFNLNSSLKKLSYTLCFSILIVSIIQYITPLSPQFYPFPFTIGLFSRTLIGSLLIVIAKGLSRSPK